MKKYQKFFVILALHCLFSGVGWGVVQVYQKGYNTTHQQSIQMADVNIHAQNAEVQILHYHLPFPLPSENSLFYYGVYLLTDTPLHNWMAFLTFLEI